MYPDIEIYNSLVYSENPSSRWRNMEMFGHMQRTDQYKIDQSNLLFCYNMFLKSLKKSKSFSFGYEHDAILYALDGVEEPIDLVNIDHHDDYLCAMYCRSDGKWDGLDRERQEIINHGMVNEGNWIAYLDTKGILERVLWIHNPNSNNVAKVDYIEDKINLIHGTKDQCEIHNYEYDHVFVCLSPQYMPQEHWHYFAMFITAYEEFTGKDANVSQWMLKKFCEEKRLKEHGDKLIQDVKLGR